MFSVTASSATFVKRFRLLQALAAKQRHRPVAAQEQAYALLGASGGVKNDG